MCSPFVLALDVYFLVNYVAVNIYTKALRLSTRVCEKVTL